VAQQYPNRSDLRNPATKLAPTAVPGQTYGEAGKQIAAQQAVPMAAPQQAPVPQAPRSVPGQGGPLNRPTERPMEPTTAGAPFGPGRNAPIGGYIAPRNNDPILDELRALYATYPSDDLADMLDSYIREGY
jgi:hypothetical protein